MPLEQTTKPGYGRLHCDCGTDRLLLFGPFGRGPGRESDHWEPDLRYVLTCSKCGEQLRVYQTSDAWRKREVPPVREGGS